MLNILHNPSIEWLDIGRETAAEAALLAKTSGIKINDALIAQQAIENGAKVFT